MKKIFTESLFPTVLATILSFFLSFINSYINMPDVIINVGEVVKVKNQYQVSVSIFNQGKRDIHKIETVFPDEIKTSDIYTSDKLILNQKAGNGQNVFEIGGVRKGQSIQMTLFFQNPINPEKINFLSSELNVSVNYFNQQVDATQGKVVREALIQTIVFLLIFGSFNYFSVRRMNETKELLNRFEDNHKNQIERVEKNSEIQLDFYKEQLDQLKSVVAKTRILNARRTYEYKKELSFWRDTIRKIIYNSGRTEREANNMFNQISTHLKTHQTHKEERDVETLMQLEEMYAYKNNEKNK
ncbi:hypothetical protein [Paenibacillus amylolyticus]|uniref:hypothetical protein n=1 Tax=Paenibacillus amylolyticus TaxID=1451 RepID=UPI003D991A35